VNVNGSKERAVTRRKRGEGKGGGNIRRRKRDVWLKRGRRSSDGKLIDRYGFFLSSCAQCSREEWAIRRDLYRLNDDVLTRVDL